MPELNEDALLAFRDELQKIGGVGDRLTGAGALGGLGLGVGALGGGLYSGVKNYREARREGHGVGGSLARGASGALGGAVSGGAVGALGGAAMGAAAPSLGARAASHFGQSENSLGSLVRAGQRQVHGLTGHGDIRALRGGAHDASQALKDHQSKAVEALLGDNPAAEHGALKSLRGAIDSHAAMSKAEEMGLTSVPGTLKSVKNHGLLPTIGAGFKAGWEGTPTWAKALTGAGLAANAHGLYKNVKEPGEDRGERIGRSTAGTAAGLLFSPVLPMGAGMAASEAITHAGGLVGKGVDKMRRRRTPIGEINAGPGQHPADATGQTAPSEIIRTPSAAGQVPEMVGA